MSIQDLVKLGVSIADNPMVRIEVAYSGDTCARGLTTIVKRRNENHELKTVIRRWANVSGRASFVQIHVFGPFGG